MLFMPRRKPLCSFCQASAHRDHAGARAQHVLVVARRALRQPGVLGAHVGQEQVRQLVHRGPVAQELRQRPALVDEEVRRGRAAAQHIGPGHRLVAAGARHDDELRLRDRKRSVQRGDRTRRPASATAARSRARPRASPPAAPPAASRRAPRFPSPGNARTPPWPASRRGCARPGRRAFHPRRSPAATARRRRCPAGRSKRTSMSSSGASDCGRQNQMPRSVMRSCPTRRSGPPPRSCRPDARARSVR